MFARIPLLTFSEFLYRMVLYPLTGGFVSKLDKKTLQDLAELCKIHCSDEEIEKLHKNLQSILNYIDHLKEVDTEGVEICNHVSETVSTVMREDEVGEMLSRETFLENSPSHVGGMIRVPPVIKF